MQLNAEIDLNLGGNRFLPYIVLINYNAIRRCIVWAIDNVVKLTVIYNG
jgi:hypothetical protein